MQRFRELTDSQLCEQASTILRRFFGYTSFRSRQLEIIISALRGRDTVVLMPTGGGKSLTFQIPALILPGLTIVVSPLLSLMRDQVEALIANGIPAATINSLQSEDENRAVTDAIGAGHIKLLYISPERLLADMPRWRHNLNISLIAIDEAHCISRWGHDFRPDYTRLAEIRLRRPDIPIIALTATADRLTRDDIARQLLLENPLTVITSFDRPNLSLRVETESTPKRRLDTIASLIDRYPSDTGIVYCLSRKTTENVASQLQRMGYRVEPYHAAMSADHRLDVQRRFRSGELEAVVATVAFGMGIDKSNIRWIVHNNMPSCIESYYQEIGRAGRDGLPAETIMFYSIADLISLRKFAEESGQAAVNMEKLKRMSQYAEANVCRRRILLSYFGETLDHDCGNCDVCLAPPKRYDASTEVRKALSAIIRTGEQAGATMLTDILRGSARADLVAKGFDRIKTYGAGRDTDAATWQSIILQMVQLGLVDIAYDRGNHLTVTPYGRSLLFSQQPIMLAKTDIDPLNRRPRTPSRPAKPVRTPETVLRELRASIAAKEGIAPYLVMSDPSLLAIATKLPETLEEFASVEGISDRKAVAYWSPVAKALGKVVKGYKPTIEHSRHSSLFLLRRGNSPAEIATLRHIGLPTVYSHFTDLLVADALTQDELLAIVDPVTYRSIIDIYISGPRESFGERLNGRYPNGLERFVLALGRKRGLVPPITPATSK
ncbi:MAG: RecQ family ATP-dependent DNA helicase [Bacteroides sp.]|nr:RecQ family ATP-dependent DNA helicase [Bacteroides sp.]